MRTPRSTSRRAIRHPLQFALPYLSRVVGFADIEHVGASVCIRNATSSLNGRSAQELFQLLDLHLIQLAQIELAALLLPLSFEFVKDRICLPGSIPRWEPACPDIAGETPNPTG